MASSSLGREKAENTPACMCLATEAGGKSYVISCRVCQLQGPRFLDFNCLSQGKLLNVTVRDITGPVIHHRCNRMFRGEKAVVLSQKIRCPRINKKNLVIGESLP